MKYYLVLFSIIVSGCAGFPTLHPHFITINLDQQATNVAGHPVYTGVCTEYPEIGQADACTNTFGPGIEHPLDYCAGNFTLPDTDVAALREYQKQQCANGKKSTCTTK